MDVWCHTPLWALRILVAELPGVEAEATRRLVQAAAFPHLKEGARRELLRDLDDRTRPRGGGRAPDLTELLASDLDAAADYLTSLGIAVQRVSTA